ncbi:MAG: GIY-YIG nuclease family protein [Chitinophagaceae bacterium]|nr:MAG: GIY-YIG nuclease family protein [Chitinophagaceae bacterium]
MKGGYTYILTNYRRTVLYVGVTSDLRRRLREHREQLHPGSFTARYQCFYLVYFEQVPGIVAAIQREKQLKEWPRQRKLELIRTVNPHLYFYHPHTLLLSDTRNPLCSRGVCCR